MEPGISGNWWDFWNQAHPFCRSTYHQNKCTHSPLKFGQNVVLILYIFILFIFWLPHFIPHRLCVYGTRVKHTRNDTSLLLRSNVVATGRTNCVWSMEKPTKKKKKRYPWLGIQFAYAIQFNCRTLIESMNTLNSLWCVFSRCKHHFLVKLLAISQLFV